jgi:Myosin head (motor domain)
MNGYDSFVWVKKDVIQRIQNGENQRRTNHVMLSNRKSNRDSWQWIRARLIGACKDENPVKKDPSSSPYGNVKLRRVAQDSTSQRLNNPSIINQHIVTLIIEDPEAGPDLNHKSFSLTNSQEDSNILIANSWWNTGGNPPHDLTTLNHLHEPAVVFCLRQRYEMDQIYTYTGRILLALNPFRQIRNLYGQSVMEVYRDPSSLTNRPAPHVYATAQDAYSSMLRDNQNQSILVSGESGAGKTVTTKIILGYLTTLSKWKANESFGVKNGGIESQGQSEKCIDK